MNGHDLREIFTLLCRKFRKHISNNWTYSCLGYVLGNVWFSRVNQPSQYGLFSTLQSFYLSNRKPLLNLVTLFMVQYANVCLCAIDNNYDSTAYCQWRPKTHLIDNTPGAHELIMRLVSCVLYIYWLDFSQLCWTDFNVSEC